MTFLFSYGRGIRRVYAGYSWGIHGIYVCIGYVSGMYRVCIGNVSKATGRVGGGVPTTDEHGWTRKHDIYPWFSVGQCSSVVNPYRRKMSLCGRYTNHRRARTGTETRYISLVQCRSVHFSGQSITAERCLSVGDIPTTDEHGWARKHDIYILGSV